MTGKAYFQINGTRYMGYDIVTNEGSLILTKCICVNREMRNELENPDSTLYSQFVPKKGDEINIVPKCPIAIDDIRKNYKTKRGYDTGVCNVVSAPGNYQYSRWCTYCVLPKHKTVFICTDWNGRNDRNYLLRMVYSRFNDVGPIDCVFSDTNNSSDAFWYNVHDAWHAFLDGILTKPVISYKKLTLNSDNELTLDVLRLAYKVSNKELPYGNEPSKDEESAVIVELNALNNYNWREYPGTMSMIFYTLLRVPYGSMRYYHRHRTIYDNMANHSSRYSKAVKGIMNLRQAEFASNKDLKMAQDFLRAELGIGDRKFVSIGDLKSKLDEIDMTLQDFGKVFSSIVKIEERKIDNEEKN